MATVKAARITHAFGYLLLTDRGQARTSTKSRGCLRITEILSASTAELGEL